jgi:hypothetical protein
MTMPALAPGVRMSPPMVRVRALLVAVLVCTASGVLRADAAQPAPGGAPAAVQQPPDKPTMDARAQYPKFMENSFFTFSVGFIGYRFNQRQLEPGFQAESVDKPKLAVRVDLFGHRFNKYLSAQAVYMRPAWFVQYHNINGTTGTQQVSNAYAGMTLAVDVPVTNKISLYGEGGGGITSRSGALIDGQVALPAAHYTSGMLGAGLDIVASRTMDLMLSATYVPGREAFLQPSTRMFTAGVRYHMRTVPDAAVQENSNGDYVFPENIVRAGFTTNVFSYAMNDLFSRKIPIFWGGHVEARQGFTIDYQRNVFHSKKVFAFDLGVSGSVWGTDGKGDTFATLSGYPMFRFFFLRSHSADMYFNYSVAGPTFISKSVLDNQNTGARFTFQDFMGVGTLLGRDHRFNVEMGIKHYSNGNLFTTNASVKVPLTFSIGYTF